MLSSSQTNSELFGMSDEDFMDEGQIDLLNKLKEAESDPALQKELARKLEGKYGLKVIYGPDGIQVLEKNHDKPEDIVKFWREALGLSVFIPIPKEKLN